MGLSESSLSTILKPFECLSHCKITASSPCCKACFDEGYQCAIDTHQYESEEASVTSADSQKILRQVSI